MVSGLVAAGFSLLGWALLAVLLICVAGFVAATALDEEQARGKRRLASSENVGWLIAD